MRLAGARSGVLLAQQTEANLHAAVKTAVYIGKPGLAPAKVVVQGIVDLPAADSMFQAIGAPPGASLQAPPDNVVLLPKSQWQSTFAQVATALPTAVHIEFHVRLSSVLLPRCRCRCRC